MGVLLEFSALDQDKNINKKLIRILRLFCHYKESLSQREQRSSVKILKLFSLFLKLCTVRTRSFKRRPLLDQGIIKGTVVPL